jgi:hypothetical protein
MKFYISLIFTSIAICSAQAMEETGKCYSISPLDSLSKPGSPSDKRISTMASSETVLGDLPSKASTPFVSVLKFTTLAAAGAGAPTFINPKDAAEKQRIAETIKWQNRLNLEHYRRLMDAVAIDYFTNVRSRRDYNNCPAIMEKLSKNRIFITKQKEEIKKQEEESAHRIASEACSIATDQSLKSSPARRLIELGSLEAALSKLKDSDGVRLVKAQQAGLLTKIERMPHLEI